jgi:hypothetical protein
MFTGLAFNMAFAPYYVATATVYAFVAIATIKMFAGAAVSFVAFVPVQKGKK